MQLASVTLVHSREEGQGQGHTAYSSVTICHDPGMIINDTNWGWAAFLSLPSLPPRARGLQCAAEEEREGKRWHPDPDQQLTPHVPSVGTVHRPWPT